MVTALRVASVKRMFCVSNILPLAYISIDPLFDLTHLLSIVNSTSSSSFPCERKWMLSQQVDSPVKRDTLQESVLFGGICKPASTFCYRACNRFDSLHVLPAIILASHTSNVIPVILADSYFRPCRPNVIHSAEPLVVAPPSAVHPSLFHRPPAIPFPFLSHKLSALPTDPQHERGWISLVHPNHPAPLPALTHSLCRWAWWHLNMVAHLGVWSPGCSGGCTLVWWSLHT